MIDHADLWRKARALARTWPYCAGSEYYAHLEAAREVAGEADLDLPQFSGWMVFVNQQISSMSIYAGD